MTNAPIQPDPATPCLALRIRAAAAALGVSERTLWAWTACGDVPCVKRGAVTLYPVDVLRRWLDEQAGRGGAMKDHAIDTLTAADFSPVNAEHIDGSNPSDYSTATVRSGSNLP